ncbi:MAG: hypothetical protein LC791_03335 [Acidobacteria bacterium]|nr:hypothetical protein [Acidobacteriota bacterium]
MRIAPASIDSVDERIRRVLDAQAARWGSPLLNHLLYARVPAIFAAVRSMWSGLGSVQLVEPDLEALVNRRVAALNRCVF